MNIAAVIAILIIAAIISWLARMQRSASKINNDYEQTKSRPAY